jgi:hypothetical protein
MWIDKSWLGEKQETSREKDLHQGTEEGNNEIWRRLT